MRLNKTFKAIAVALPIMALSACSSNEDMVVDGSTNTNAEEVTTTENVQGTAAKKAADIQEQKRKNLQMLRQNHIIYFGFDTSTIDSKFASILDAHAKYLSENTDVNVLVEGHADERGTPEYNIALGERRAKAVVTYLENMGVSSGQLTVVSYGEEKPLVKERSEAAFDQNRRAVLVY